MKILGIDPGRRGGIALLNCTDRCVTTYPMPLDTAGVQLLLAELTPVALAVLEEPYAPRKNGTTKIAAQYRHVGALEASLAFFEVPMHHVRACDWKRQLNVAADKNRARARASEFFPANADQWQLAKDDGRAEAALLAWYGLRFI